MENVSGPPSVKISSLRGMIAGLGICCMMRPALKPEMVCGTFPRRLVYFDSLVVLPCFSRDSRRQRQKATKLCSGSHRP